MQNNDYTNENHNNNFNTLTNSKISKSPSFPGWVATYSGQVQDSISRTPN